MTRMSKYVLSVTSDIMLIVTQIFFSWGEEEKMDINKGIQLKIKEKNIRRESPKIQIQNSFNCKSELLRNHGWDI
jgi:preprotein translocase subunit SecF